MRKSLQEKRSPDISLRFGKSCSTRLDGSLGRNKAVPLGPLVSCGRPTLGLGWCVSGRYSGTLPPGPTGPGCFSFLGSRSCDLTRYHSCGEQWREITAPTRRRHTPQMFSPGGQVGGRQRSVIAKAWIGGSWVQLAEEMLRKSHSSRLQAGVGSQRRSALDLGGGCLASALRKGLGPRAHPPTRPPPPYIMAHYTTSQSRWYF